MDGFRSWPPPWPPWPPPRPGRQPGRQTVQTMDSWLPSAGFPIETLYNNGRQKAGCLRCYSNSKHTPQKNSQRLCSISFTIFSLRLRPSGNLLLRQLRFAIWQVVLKSNISHYFHYITDYFRETAIIYNRNSIQKNSTKKFLWPRKITGRQKSLLPVIFRGQRIFFVEFCFNWISIVNYGSFPKVISNQ